MAKVIGAAIATLTIASLVCPVLGFASFQQTSSCRRVDDVSSFGNGYFRQRQQRKVWMSDKDNQQQEEAIPFFMRNDDEEDIEDDDDDDVQMVTGNTIPFVVEDFVNWAGQAAVNAAKGVRDIDWDHVHATVDALASRHDVQDASGNTVSIVHNKRRSRRRLFYLLPSLACRKKSTV